jgi:hypothetical protein
VEKWGWRAPTSPKAIPGFPAGQVGSAVGALFINNSNLQKSNDLVKGKWEREWKIVLRCLLMFRGVKGPIFLHCPHPPLTGFLFILKSIFGRLLEAFPDRK